MDQVTALTLLPAAGSLPVPVSGLLASAVLLLSASREAWPKLDEGLALVPHHTIFSPVASCPVPFCWNVVTSHLLEASLAKAIVAAPCLWALTRMLERLWTPRALFFHLVTTAACCGVVMFILQVLDMQRTHRERDFFAATRGSVGLLVALAVGLRHAYPLEALPLLPRSWGLQCQHLPFGLTAAAVVVGLAAPRWLLPEWPFAPLALFFAWLNLRYLMWFPHARAHGDHSPDFCFAALFPRPLRPLVSCVGALTHRCGAAVAPGFVKLREADTDFGHAIVYDPNHSSSTDPWWPGSGAATHPPGPSPLTAPAVVPGGPGSREYDARRAKALRLLDENINSLLAPGGSWAPSSQPERRSSAVQMLEAGSTAPRGPSSADAAPDLEAAPSPIKKE